MAFQHDDPVALRCQCVCGGSTGDAGSNHHNWLVRDGSGWALKPDRSVRRCGVKGGERHSTAEHFPLAAKARALDDFETDLLQATPNHSGCGEGRKGAARPAKACNFTEQLFIPELRVACRGETVQKPGIDSRIESGQRLQCISQQQRQQNAPGIKHEGIGSGDRLWVTFKKLLGPIAEFGKVRQSLPEIGSA